MLRQILTFLLTISWPQAGIAGVALGIGFIEPALWWLSIPAIMWAIHAIEQTPSSKKLLILLAIVWGVKSLCSLIWFWSAYPIDWIDGMSSLVQVTLITVYWITSSVWLSSGGIIFGLVCIGVKRQRIFPYYTYWVLLPALWLVAEVLSAIVFSAFTAGPGSFLQSYFSFGMVGYLLGITPFGIWAGAIAGVYGLTFIIVAIAVLFYLLFQHLALKKIVGMFVVFITLMYVIAFPSSIERTNTTSVISIDTTFDPQFLASENGYETKSSLVAEAVEQALSLNPETIILPEDSRYLQDSYDVLRPRQALEYISFNFPSTTALIIDSGRTTLSNGETVLRATAFDTKNKLVWQFDKQYLVPQGEYVPTAYGTVLRALGYGAMVNAVAKNSAYRPGPLPQTADLPRNIPAVLFCFESVNPQGAIVLGSTRNVSFIAHPISHGWFHHSEILWQQLDVMLKIQARYAGMPIVSAGNMARGKMYLPNGSVEYGTEVGGGERFILRQFIF